MLCHAVPCYAVGCGAVRCGAVCAVLCCAALCFTVLCNVEQSNLVPCNAVPCVLYPPPLPLGAVADAGMSFTNQDLIELMGTGCDAQQVENDSGVIERKF